MQAKHSQYLAAALEYVQLGWSILPCDPQSKAPLTRTGFKDATTDAAQVGAWWQEWPGAIIGAAIPPNGVVIDLDPRAGLEVDAFLSTYDLPAPDQIMVWSGRGDGGLHLYFTRPHHGRLRGHPQGWAGVDVKAGGTGYVIVPPSRHPATGEPYEFAGPVDTRTIWTTMPQPLADAITEPEAPAPRITRVDDKPPRGDRAAGYRRRFDALAAAIVPGNRNRGLYDAVQICSRENFPGNWLSALQDHAASQGLRADEIERTTRSALGRTA